MLRRGENGADDGGEVGLLGQGKRLGFSSCCWESLLGFKRGCCEQVTTAGEGTSGDGSGQGQGRGRGEVCLLVPWIVTCGCPAERCGWLGLEW